MNAPQTLVPPIGFDAAEPLVILPGLLCDSRMFQSQLAVFGGCAIDGFYGGADRIGAMVDHALARMPGRCALFGHSMGARVAIELYRRAPERVARLALADTGVHPVRAGEAGKRYALRTLGREKGDEALVDAWLPSMIGPSRRDDPALLDVLRPMATDAGVRTFDRQIEALLNRPDARAILPDIACPTFVIVGSDDSWSPVDQHEELARAIPGAQLRIIEDAGHMAPAEAPETFNDALYEWLRWPSATEGVNHDKSG